MPIIKIEQNGTALYHGISYAIEIGADAAIQEHGICTSHVREEVEIRLRLDQAMQLKDLVRKTALLSRCVKSLLAEVEGTDGATDDEREAIDRLASDVQYEALCIADAAPILTDEVSHDGNGWKVPDWFTDMWRRYHALVRGETDAPKMPPSYDRKIGQAVKLMNEAAKISKNAKAKAIANKTVRRSKKRASK